MKKLALIPMGIALIGLWTDLHAADKESDKSNGDAANTQAVFSWQTSPTTDGITHSDIGYPYAAFIVHTVGDVSKPLVYSFYIITDPHIGGLDAPYTDYNKPGWDKPYNLSYGHTGNPNGSYPGDRLSWAVRLLNQDYQFGQGNGRFCVILGDVSNSGEIAEQEHARIKLDSIDCPWVSEIGNHDTYPYCGAWNQKDWDNEEDKPDDWAGPWDTDDRYFSDVFLSQFVENQNAFPEWKRADLTKDKPHCQNWAFDWGANRHLGLDFCKRSIGGWRWTAELFDNSGPNKNGVTVPRTFPWFRSELEYSAPLHESGNLLIYAHHPLSADFLLPTDQFQISERTSIAGEVNDNYGSEKRCYWFGGHYHTKTNHSERWAVGVGIQLLNPDTVIEAHLLPGIYGKEPSPYDDGRYFVGLVEVHDDYKCDFTYSFVSANPHWPNIGDVVTFSDQSVKYNPSGYPSSRNWKFGDRGSASGSSPSHIYKLGYPRKYFTQLKATFSGQETYCSKPVLVGYNYPQWAVIHFSPISKMSSMSSIFNLQLPGRLTLSGGAEVTKSGTPLTFRSNAICPQVS